MEFQSFINTLEGMAGVYAFDILPDGSYSEIRVMALSASNTALVEANPNAPTFYPGIPWRRYFTDLNFEAYIYQCASTKQLLYSYVNAHGFWLKGFYLPINLPGESETPENQPKTVQCLYVGSYSPVVESDSMSQHSSEVTSAVMNISIKLHETPDFYQSMSAAVEELRKACGARACALYLVDTNNQGCSFINEQGQQQEMLAKLSAEMGCTPYEVALTWEKVIADSDCLMTADLHMVEERDALWYQSLCRYGVESVILYAVRFNQSLVGFIWATNYDTSKAIQIKETLELTSFLIGAVIANHQLVSRLELMSTVDGLTQLSNRNALNERLDKLSSGEVLLPQMMGVAYADLNGLKAVNDLHGHNAGDKLLKRAAALLKLAFGDYEIYRAGGDEFVIFCPDITEEQLRQQEVQFRALTETTPDVRFAIGTGWFSGSYDIHQAMQLADERMYRDKAEYYRLHPDLDKRREA